MSQLSHSKTVAMRCMCTSLTRPSRLMSLRCTQVCESTICRLMASLKNPPMIRSVRPDRTYLDGEESQGGRKQDPKEQVTKDKAERSKGQHVRFFWC